MTTDAIPLGTAAALPTPDRHLSAFALKREGRILLFDCGEGTQFRLLHEGLSHARIDAIFITHAHGDHWFGLPGLLSTMALQERTAPVTLVAPAGLYERVDTAADLGNLPFPVESVPLEAGVPADPVYATDAFTVRAAPLDHRAPTHGYRFQERTRRGRFHPEKARALGVTDPGDFGRLTRGESVTTAAGRTVQPDEVLGPERPGIGVAYVTDTQPCEGGRDLAAGADLLYHDATFANALTDRARYTKHSTARDAATVARDAGCQRLLLGHISARYPNAEPLAHEAQAVFPNSEVAREGHCYTFDPRAKWTDEGLQHADS
mgnify:CR=1 FL=1